MPKGDKSVHVKQKRQSGDIEEGYEKQGVSKARSRKTCLGDVNKSAGRKKSGSAAARRHKASSRKGGKKGGKNTAAEERGENRSRISLEFRRQGKTRHAWNAPDKCAFALLPSTSSRLDFTEAISPAFARPMARKILR